MSLLLKNSTPAERERGCTFAENFRNTSEVVANGGTIVGTPSFDNGATFDGTNDGISYGLCARGQLSEDNAFSITVDFDIAVNHGTIQCLTEFGPGIATKDSGMILIDTNNNTRLYTNNGAGIFTGIPLTAGRHTMTVSWDGASQRRMYVDGVRDNAGSSVGATGTTTFGTNIGMRLDGSLKTNGTIYSVKYFNRILTLAEHIDQYNETTYDYINQTVLDLPMGMAQHDPTNVRTLDISGNGNDAIFGDGSTSSTYPTKLTRSKGYNFDGGDYLTANGIQPYTNTGYSISLWFKSSDLTQETGTLFAEANSGTNAPLFMISTGEAGNTEKLRYFLRDDDTATKILSHGDTIISEGWTHLVFTDLNGDAKAYINGVEDTRDLSYTYDQVLTINRSAIGALLRSTSDFYFDGSISSFKTYPIKLTQMQIADLYKRELKQVNDK